ncbi:MAG: FAD-dependent monooxygenase [Hyphomicrobiales bacterium]|nr:FAD-dependent monooxygenase [Hyphomicrobiales bacterium]
MTDKPVIVAGAGVGGLAAAVALAKAGKRVVVVERAPRLQEVGAGLQLSPNATRRLAKWDALDALAGKATAPEVVEIRRGRDGAKLAEIPVGEALSRWGAPYLVAHRADLLNALAAAVARHPAIELRLASALDGWKAADDGVVVHLDSGETVAGVALIGADGVRSRVREGLGLIDGDTPRFSGLTAWRTLIAADAVEARFRAPRGALWLGSGAHLVHYPLRGGSVINVVAIIPEPWSERQGQDFWSSEGEAHILISRYDGWDKAARDLIAAAPQWRRWPLFVRRALTRWSRGPVALLGDAAHAMAPFLAQGAAQAIEDADALGAGFAQHPGDVGKALEAYEARRIARATRIQRASRMQGRVYHLGGPAAFARETAMRAIGPEGMARASDWIFRE